MEVELEFVSPARTFNEIINNASYNNFINNMKKLNYHNLKEFNPIIIREVLIAPYPSTLDNVVNFLNNVVGQKNIPLDGGLYKLYKIKINSEILNIFHDKISFINKCLRPLWMGSVYNILINVNGYCSYYPDLNRECNLIHFVGDTSNKYNLLMLDSIYNTNHFNSIISTGNIKNRIKFEGNIDEWTKKFIHKLPPSDRFSSLKSEDIINMLDEYPTTNLDDYFITLRPNIIMKPWHPINNEWFPKINIQMDGEIIVEDAQSESTPESNINLSSISAELDYTKKMLERSEHLRKADRDVSEKIINQINPFLNKKIVLPPFEKL